MRRSARLTIVLAAVAAAGALGSIAASCDREPGGHPSADGGVSRDGGGSVDASTSSANLRVIVRDDDNDQLLPSRVDLAANGRPMALTFSNDTAGVPLGRDSAGQLGSIALLTGDGEARIAPGTYDLTIQRGIEYDIARVRVDVPATGIATVNVRLIRAFATQGWVGADLHVHQAPSNDSDVPAQDRVVSLVTEGIEVVAAADHNENFDLAGATRTLDMERWMFAISGNEVSLDTGHFNIFPVPYDAALPHGGSPMINANWDIAGMLATFRAPPEDEITQINHPRLISPPSYFTTVGWDPSTGAVARPPFVLDFDAVEILNGIEAKREDIEQILKDWLGLLERGHVLTATGNSDTHRIASAKAGSPRTFLRVPDDRPAMLTLEAVRQAIRGRHVIATSGPWLVVTVNDSAGPGDSVTVPAGNDVRLHIEIDAANFVPVDRLRVFANGNTVVASRTIGSSINHVRFDETLTIPRPAVDTFYVVVADANTPLPRELAGRMDRDTFSYAIANPVFVDVDGLAPFQFPMPRLPASLTSGLPRPDLTPIPWWRELDHASVIEFDDCEMEGLEVGETP